MKLVELKKTKKGNLKTLEGNILKGLKKIGSPHEFRDDWETTWRREMIEGAPKNAKYFTAKTEERHYMNGMEPVPYYIAYVQFYKK